VIVPLLTLVAVIEKGTSVTFLERFASTPDNVAFPRDTVRTVVSDVGA
jgi:hypothetical protein